MIDPLLSLSFNIHAQRGTYAILIGSGVSRSASIPTGWEVTLDLVRKLAHLEGEDCDGREVEWYLNKFGKEPDYSSLLSSVAQTSAAQQHLLKSYFEPTDDERETGDKLPTPAHRSIAKLVRAGYLRVIVTTNFDRLLETALEAEGIAPVVIASPDAAKGAPPFVHSSCTVIKVHGDYLDYRIKNSPDALSKYEKPINQLLDRVFDEYGLIVAGWSAEYDVALRKALERSKTRRYPMFWTGRSEPSGAARDLIALHQAQFVRVSDADSFFSTLAEKVDALEEFGRPHPLSTEAAIVTLKRYLSEDKYRIPLRDFLITETEQVTDSIIHIFSAIGNEAPTQESTYRTMGRIESGCENLIHLFANGSFYGQSTHSKVFFESFYLILAQAHSTGGYKVWIDLKKYPALLLAYSAGISAAYSENYQILYDIATKESFIKHDDDKSVPAPVRLFTHSVLDRDTARQLMPGKERRKTPVSDHLFDVLRSVFARLIPDDEQYTLAFDNFEYLWCLLRVDAQLQRRSDWLWPPFGAFCWRRGDFGRSANWFKDQAEEASKQSESAWPPLKGGLFGGSPKRLFEAIERAEPVLEEIRRKFMF